MSDHNLSARMWATGALLAVPLASLTNTGWWLPLHMALLGAVTQAIVGGQLMFSATLGLARGPQRRVTLTQLALLNLAAILIIAGRLAVEPAVLAMGATVLLSVIGWVAWRVHLMWRSSVNRRFSITGTFYRLAATSLLIGASIGGALALGAFDDGGSYIDHRSVHMTVNVFGWAGMTIVGTAITLLPTIMHVRAPNLKLVRWAPWLMAGGLTVMALGATIGLDPVAGLGMTMVVAGLGCFAIYVKAVIATPRRRRIPTAAFHLIAAFAWAVLTSIALVISMTRGDDAATRDLVVVGGGAGFAFQSLLGAWSFLLPSTRPPDPQRSRAELVAMELGGRLQVAAYNFGVLVILIGLRTDLAVSLAGTAFTWCASVGAMTKLWSFPLLARLGSVQALSARWWAPPETP